MTAHLIIRAATDAEVLDYYLSKHGFRRKVSYRHFIKELYCPRAESGVQRRRRTTATIHDIDGVPHVIKDGAPAALTGDHCTLGEHRWIGDLRLASEHLPSDLL